MRHARPDDLMPIAPLLVELRRIAGLTERMPGSFYRKGTGAVHFHHDPAGMFADVKVGPCLTAAPGLHRGGVDGGAGRSP